MIHLPKRYFFQARNQKHYKKRGKQMGGPIYTDAYTQTDASTIATADSTTISSVQDAIDSLNKAIDRLDNLIKEMGQNYASNK